MKSRWFVFVLVASLLLAACGGKSVSGGEKVTIRFWSHQNDAFNEGYQALADEYTKQHANIQIQFETFDYDTYIQTLQTALPAGTEADIMQMFGSWVCSYAEGGNLAEMPSRIISIANAKEQVFGAPLGGYLCDDKLYGIPQEFNIEYGAVLVNTTLAEEQGITVDGWSSWDEFISDAKKLAIVQDGVMTRAGFNFTGSDGIATMFHSLYLQYGGQYLVDGTYHVNTPEGGKTLELMKRLVDEGLDDPILFNDEQNWVGDSYFEETSAIGLVGPWVVPEYGTDYPEVAEATQYVLLPSVGATPVFAAASGWGLVVSKNSKVQDAAWDFINFITLDPQNATSWNLASGTLPALIDNATGKNADSLVAEFPFFKPFLGILQYGQFEGKFPDRDFVWYEVTYPRVLNFLQGNATLEDTLATIENEVQGSFK
jgi:multiple sugar transport system substrate-binding protein